MDKENSGGRIKRQIPPELDVIAKTVLRYKPPEKEKTTKQRAKRKRQRDAKKA